MQSSLKVLPITPTIAAASLIEPEDARITGQTRSLPRRLLALNMPLNNVRKPALSSTPVLTPRTRIA